jgi:hypothetical protein
VLDIGGIEGRAIVGLDAEDLSQEDAGAEVEEKAQEMGLTTSAYIKHLIHNAFNN